MLGCSRARRAHSPAWRRCRCRLGDRRRRHAPSPHSRSAPWPPPGVAVVRASRRPRVAVLATGSELRPPGSALAAGPDLRGEHTAARRAARGRGRGRRPARAGGRRPRKRRSPRSSTGSRATCSSRREASRWGRTISCAPPSRSWASRRCSGVSPCGRAGRSPSAFAGRTLVFGLPGNPVSSLVGCELFVRPAVLALQGAAAWAVLSAGAARSHGAAELAGAAASRAGTERPGRRRARAAARTGVAHDRHVGRRRRARADRAGEAELPAGSPVRYLTL